MIIITIIITLIGKKTNTCYRCKCNRLDRCSGLIIGEPVIIAD
jgi:hypothetical protein